MKNLYLLLAGALLLTAGCSEREPGLSPTAAARAAAVEFRLEADLDTETTLEPMTRAGTVREMMSNQCRMLVLRRDAQRWIVDTTLTQRIDTTVGIFNELIVTDRLPSTGFRLEMQPGDYRIVAVLNGDRAVWNEELLPGVTVADGANPSTVPPLVVYRISDHVANPGYRMLNREIFVAVSDFTVPKSGDLHGEPMPPVTLQAVRRVGKMRLMLKNRPSPDEEFNFIGTAYTFRMVLRATERPFVLGVDALGDAYYGDEPLYELPWSLSTIGDFQPAGSGSYLTCNHNSTVFSPFLFTDPKVDLLPFEVTNLIILGYSGGPRYHAEQSYPLTLAASRISGLVFQTTDRIGGSSWQLDIAVEQSFDDEGEPEDPVKLFDAFFEWNVN